ncbi:MAG: type II toxin-antitoxin system HicA family toxin [Clostridia bacterium]|jgi:predicted RNA binding protein YcfA (HicA-like mRNA interferase family)
MSRLPRISGRQATAVFTQCGLEIIRQKGSHIVLRRSDPFSPLIIPDHQERDTGTLRAIIRQADLSVDDFIHKL